MFLDTLATFLDTLIMLSDTLATLGYNDPHPSAIVYIWTLVLEGKVSLPNFTVQNRPYEICPQFYGLELSLRNFPPILPGRIGLTKFAPNFTWQNRPYEICPQFYVAELSLYTY